jgi:predicted transcriptional regulator of viral defense system
MRLSNFFAEHPVFRYEELLAYLQAHGKYNLNTLKALLQYHLAKKNISRIRRGYYMVTSHLFHQLQNDNILIAGRMTEDAVISYHTAIEFHALSYSIYQLSYLCTVLPKGKILSQHGSYQQVAHPKPLQSSDIFFETKLYDRQGLDIRVTTVERTLVDCLDKPQFSGGWEEIWRSLESANFLDVDRIVQYALRFNNATTIAKVGFFLEQYQQQFSVDEKLLFILEKHKPKSKHYMQYNKRELNQYAKRWNLIVPLSVINKSWEEPNHDI